MNIVKYIFAVVVIFDVVYFFLYASYDLCTTIHAKITKKKKPAPYDFEIMEEDESDSDHDFSLAPPLCIDAIRMVYGKYSRDLVVDRIFPESREIIEQLSEQDKESVILLLSSYIRYLNRKAPKYEQNFTMLMEMLKYSDADSDPEHKDAVELVMEDKILDSAFLPDYYMDYQKYKLTCKNKAHIITICKVLILNVLKKLYGEHYSVTDELSPVEPIEPRLADIPNEDDTEYEEDYELEVE